MDQIGTDSINSSIFDHVAKPLAQPILFPVSVLKFSLMNVATFGLYQIFWSFKSWHYLFSVGHRVRPALRAWFSIFYLYPLLKEIIVIGKAAGLSRPYYLPVKAFVLWLFLQFTAGLPDPLWLISSFAFVPLIPVLLYVNGINRCTGKGDSINSKFSIINLLAIAVGAAVLACAILNYFGKVQ